MCNFENEAQGAALACYELMNTVNITPYPRLIKVNTAVFEHINLTPFRLKMFYL